MSKELETTIKDRMNYHTGTCKTCTHFGLKEGDKLKSKCTLNPACMFTVRTTARCDFHATKFKSDS